MQDHFHNHLTQHLALAQAVQAQLGPAVHDAATLLIAAFSQGHKVLLCGNGGSAADAQHLAAELTGRYEVTDRRALPALALTTDTSALTAIGNDLGFDRVFARQVEALGQPGDVLIGISTSGHSPNVIAAVEQARRQGLKTIGLLGRDGGALAPLVDLAITIPSQCTAHIQEMHITLAHILCGLIDAAFLAPSLNAELDQGTVKLGPSDAALRPQAPAAAYATDTGTLSSTAAAPGALFPHP